jgi:drug/metabolite transporter (DMT)-like permease
MSSAQIVLIVISILLMTSLGSLGAVCFKKTSLGEEGFSIKKLIKNKWLYLGGVLYVAGAVFNIIVLRFLPYSVVLPFSSITYIWTIIFSNRFFHEKIGKFKVIAICCIVFGVVLLIL